MKETGFREKSPRGAESGYAILERLRRPALGLVVLVLALTILFLVLGIRASYDSRILTLSLSTVLVVVPSFLTAVIAARSFSRAGLWPVLWMGIGTLTFGLAVLLSNWIIVSSDNGATTVYGIVALIAGSFHLLGGFFVLNGVPAQELGPGRLSTLLQVYLSAIAFIIFVTVVTVRGLLPPFLVVGSGGTPLRVVVQATDTLLLLLAGLMLFRQSLRSRSALLHWYSLGLLLTCLSMGGTIVVMTTGTPLNWTLRGAQLLGGVYLFIAALVTLREARTGHVAESKTPASLFGRQEGGLQRLFDCVGDVIISTDTEFRITGWNKAAENIYGWKTEEVIGKDASEVLKIRYPSGLSRGEMREKLSTEGTGWTEANHTRKDAEEPNLFATANVQKNSEGKSIAVVFVFRDTTERKETEENTRKLLEDLKVHQVELETQAEELRRSQQEAQESRDRYLDLYDYAPVGYLTVEKGSGVIEANLAAAGLLGVERNELIHSQLTKFVAPDSQDALYFFMKQAFETGTRQKCEIRMHRKDGSVFYAQFEGIVVHSEGKPDSIRTTLSDITARRKAEEELHRYREHLEELVADSTRELRDLSHRLVSAQEEEREAIGKELHDEIGQYLTYTILLIDKAARKPAQQTLTEAKSTVQEAIGKIRDLSSLLSPRLLRSVGLLPALVSLIEDYSRRTPIRVQFDHTDGFEGVKEDMALASYRIIQEALTNVVRHATASEVKVRLSCQGGKLELEVADNGTGFDPKKIEHRTGLTGMRERALSLGGKLTIESRIGQGTLVAAELPLSETEKE